MTARTARTHGKHRAARTPRTHVAVTLAAAAAAAGTATAAAPEPATAADWTVAADGSGTYRTVQDAIDAVPSGNSSRITITVEPGTYREQVLVDKPYVSLVGGGTSPDDVVIVEGVSVGEANSHQGSATVAVTGTDFWADNLTVSNDHQESESKEGNQALAVYLKGDRMVLDDLRLLGDQDTVRVVEGSRVYVTDSYIEGTVDFIFGAGTAVFHRDTIYEKRDVGGPVTAAKTSADQKYGLLFFRSTIDGATEGATQLGRPWGPDAQVLYRESVLTDAIDTDQPWIDMSGNPWEDARFLEYQNTGAGAGVNGNRAQLPASDADEYTPEAYLAGDDGWAPVQRGEDGA
jgi:pectin methylesterase-like acyl-CoA thioesterase